MPGGKAVQGKAVDEADASLQGPGGRAGLLHPGQVRHHPGLEPVGSWACASSIPRVKGGPAGYKTGW